MQEINANADLQTEVILEPRSIDDPRPAPHLTDREDRFCRAFARDGDAQRALVTAGYFGEADMHTRLASRVLMEVMRQDRVSRAIVLYQRLNAIAFAVPREAVVAQLARMGFADIGDFCDPVTGDMLPPHKLPQRARAVVASVTRRRNRDGSIEWTYTLTPRVKALELISRILGFVEQKQNKPLKVRMVCDPVTGKVSSEVTLHNGDEDKTRGG